MEKSSFEYVNYDPGKDLKMKHGIDGSEAWKEKTEGAEWGIKSIPANDLHIEEKHRKMLAHGWAWINEHKPQDTFRVYEKSNERSSEISDLKKAA